MAAEATGPEGRIKFAAQRTGELQLGALPAPLQQLAALMHRLEARGMVPMLNDGLVGGNCAVAASACGLEPAAAGGVLISRSGKAPHAPLQLGDWVLLTQFDAASWAAEYRSPSEAARPSSDAPLHAAALGPGTAERYGWAAQPRVAVHGHALAEGAGLERAHKHGLPISQEATLFSTPEDLAALEAIFRCC